MSAWRSSAKNYRIARSSGLELRSQGGLATCGAEEGLEVERYVDQDAYGVFYRIVAKGLDYMELECAEGVEMGSAAQDNIILPTSSIHHFKPITKKPSSP